MFCSLLNEGYINAHSSSSDCQCFTSLSQDLVTSFYHQINKRLQSFSVEKIIILVHLFPLAILCINIVFTDFFPFGAKRN